MRFVEKGSRAEDLRFYGFGFRSLSYSSSFQGQGPNGPKVYGRATIHLVGLGIGVRFGRKSRPVEFAEHDLIRRYEVFRLAVEQNPAM